MFCGVCNSYFLISDISWDIYLLSKKIDFGHLMFCWVRYLISCWDRYLMFCGVGNNQFMIFDIWLYGDLMLVVPDKRLGATKGDETSKQTNKPDKSAKASLLFWAVFFASRLFGRYLGC